MEQQLCSQAIAIEQVATKIQKKASQYNPKQAYVEHVEYQSMATALRSTAYQLSLTQSQLHYSTTAQATQPVQTPPERPVSTAPLISDRAPFPRGTFSGERITDAQL